MKSSVTNVTEVRRVTPLASYLKMNLVGPYNAEAVDFR